MIDVGRDNGPAAGDFVAHEFARDMFGNGRPEAVAFGMLRAPEIFAHRDICHFLGDDSGAGIFQLRHAFAGLGAQGFASRAVELRNREKLARLQPIVFGAA